jgi:hypothetical protein
MTSSQKTPPTARAGSRDEPTNPVPEAEGGGESVSIAHHDDTIQNYERSISDLEAQVADLREALVAVDSEVLLTGNLKDIVDLALSSEAPPVVCGGEDGSSSAESGISPAAPARTEGPHSDGCRYLRAAVCAVEIECVHGFGACPICDPCTCKPYQNRVNDWMLACFGEGVTQDPVERSFRFLEEALELVQANGCTAEEAARLVEYVYGRPVGERAQEVGGVAVCLAALCTAAAINMDDAAERELARVWTKVEKIRAKHASKPAGVRSSLPGTTPPADHGASVLTAQPSDSAPAPDAENPSQERAAVVPAAEQAGGWRPIASAPRDGCVVLLRLADPIPVPGRADLRNWGGRAFVGKWVSPVSEWCFAAPVGHGGFPSEWMAGWMPLPPPDHDAIPSAEGGSAQSHPYADAQERSHDAQHEDGKEG